MLRRPDFESAPGRFQRSRSRVLFVAVVIALALVIVARLSPVGVFIGALAGLLIIFFGVATGWVVTYVFKIPRDGRGVHERARNASDEPLETPHSD